MKYHLIAFVILVTSSFSYAQLLNDAVAYFPFEGNVNDESNSSILVTNNGCSFGTDRDGDPNSTMYNDGSQNYLEFNDNSVKVNLPITISVWVKITTQGTNMIFVSDNEFENYHGYKLGIDANGRPGMYIAGGLGGANSSNRRTYKSNQSLNLNTWHHVVGIIRDYNDMDIYIDCIKTDGSYSGSGSTTMVYSNEPSRIGSYIGTNSTPNGWYFKGEIDELAIWDRELTSSEITSLCQSENHLSAAEGKGGDTEITIYPNPAGDVLNLSSDNEIFDRVQIYGVDGKLAAEFEDDILTVVNIENLEKGAYFIKVFNENNLLVTKKVVKQ